jgi:hypothetical protein
MMQPSEYYGHNEDKPPKEVLEASVKPINCPICGYKTEPYYMKFHRCEKAWTSLLPMANYIHKEVMPYVSKNNLNNNFLVIIDVWNRFSRNTSLLSFNNRLDNPNFRFTRLWHRIHCLRHSAGAFNFRIVYKFGFTNNFFLFNFKSECNFIIFPNQHL